MMEIMMSYMAPGGESMSPMASPSNFSSPATPPQTPDGKKRLRILCLHGFKQNGNIFKLKTSVLRKSLSDIAEFVYVDAPHIIDESKGIASWWRASSDGKEYKGWETTLDYLKNVFIKQGPFQGILGFSQGAALCSLLCSISSLKDHDIFNDYKEIQFNFALMFSGFQSRASIHQSLYPCQQLLQQQISLSSEQQPPQPQQQQQQLQQHYPLEKITTPSLHVWGKTDGLVESHNCEHLSQQFSDPQCYIHEFGHLLPTAKKDIELYRVFVKKFLDDYSLE